MITFIENGNLFESKTECWINTTNAEGVMGGGIALAFKNKFPKMFKDYKNSCQLGFHTVENVHVWKNTHSDNPLFIINFATKDKVYNPSEYSYIKSGLKSLLYHIQRLQIKSVAMPALGSGLGGLDWKKVKQIIEKWHEDNQTILNEVKVEVYEPL